MKHLKFFIFFFLITGTALLVSYRLYVANMPVAVVNGREISIQDLEASFAAGYNYYYAIAKTYGNGESFPSSEAKKELKRAALEELIQNALVSEELRKRLGGIYEEIVAKKLQDQESNQNLRRAAAAVYGTTFDTVRNTILRPIAEAELLEGKLFVENIPLEDWLKTAKESAQVSILDSDFTWSKNGVVAR